MRLRSIFAFGAILAPLFGAATAEAVVMPAAQAVAAPVAPVQDAYWVTRCRTIYVQRIGPYGRPVMVPRRGCRQFWVR